MTPNTTARTTRVMSVWVGSLFQAREMPGTMSAAAMSATPLMMIRLSFTNGV